MGFAEKPIWGRRFKFRFTSTDTGKKIDINVNRVSSYIDKKHLKEYRSEIKKIFKDLHNISRKLNKRGLVTNTI